MGKRFPYIRLEGDRERAELYLRRARAELQRTRDLAARMGVDDFQRMVKLDAESYIITKVLRGGIEIVNIYAAPHVPRKITTTKKEVVFKPIESYLYSIYSGFVYEGWMPEIEIDGNPTFPYLTQFNPTEWCRATNQNDFDDNLDYQNVPRLRIEKSDETPTQYLNWYGISIQAPPSGAKKSQYNSVRACAYTGLMAKAVSAILGYGNFNIDSPIQFNGLVNDFQNNAYLTAVKANGFQVLYDNRFTRSHHITKSSTGRLWLVEVSIINGVIAMPLKYLDKSLFRTSSDKDWPVSVIVESLNGLPSGESFPSTRQETLDLIADKVIIELMNPQNYGTAIGDDWLEYAETNCWAMNEDGTEGRVTAFRYYQGDVNFREGGYFQLIIEIGNKTGSATISSLQAPTLMVTGFKQEHNADYPPPVPPELEYMSPDSGGKVGRGTVLDILCSYYQQEAGSFTSLSTRTTLAKWIEIEPSIPDETKAIVWVGYINGAWEEVTFYTRKWNDLEETFYTDAQPRQDFGPEYSDYNIATIVSKTGFGSLGLQHWNSAEHDMVHFAHVFTTTSKGSYNKEKYTKHFKELRWNSIDNIVTQGPNVALYRYPYSINFVGSMILSDVPYEHFPNPPVDSFDITLYELFYVEITYSAFWCQDFPEINNRVVIPPHNRSAYMFYEEEYMPRRYGPLAFVAGNGGDWDATANAAYYTDNYINTGWGTHKNSFWVEGGKGNYVRQELKPGDDQVIPFPPVSYQMSSNPYRNLKHSLVHDFNLIPWGGIVDPGSFWDGLDIEYVNSKPRVITQNQSYGSPSTILTWANHTDSQYNHPHDVFTGDIGQCQNWHQRVNHFTFPNGTELFSEWKESNIWSDGLPKVYLQSEASAEIEFLWRDIGIALGGLPASPCEKLNWLDDTPIPITLPTTPAFKNIQGSPIVLADANHWSVLISNQYNDWTPYLKIENFIVCDTFGRIDFEDKNITSTATASFILPITEPEQITNYDWATNDTEDLMSADDDIDNERFHRTAHGIHIQHAVLGKPAILYSNLNTQNIKGVGFFDIIIEGVHPILPNSGGDDELFKLVTFIGVNSE